MKLAEWFKLFLIDEAMDAATAFKELELEYGDYANVDKAFKKMAMKHHPDRGGDLEKMKILNLAKATLAGGSGSASSSGPKRESPAERREINIKRVAKAKVVTDYIFKEINPQVEDFEPKLKEHLEKHTGKQFTVTTKVRKADNTIEAVEKSYTYGLHPFDGYVEWIFVFESNSEEGLTKYVIELEAVIEERNFENALSVDQLDLDLRFETSAYSEGKKTKMQMRQWGNRAKTASLGKPEDFFPSKKLVKSVTTAKGRLTKKADAFSFLQTEMKAINPYTDREIMLVPLGDDMYVRMHRNIWFKKASWSFDDIIHKKSEYSYVSTMTRGGEQSLYKKMTGKDTLSGQGEATGSTLVMEVMPDFGKIVRTVVDLIKKEKYREAGEFLAEKGKEYNEVIEPAIKAKTLK